VIKGADANIRVAFLTGLSMFSKATTPSPATRVTTPASSRPTSPPSAWTDRLSEGTICHRDAPPLPMSQPEPKAEIIQRGECTQPATLLVLARKASGADHHRLHPRIR